MFTLRVFDEVLAIGSSLEPLLRRSRTGMSGDVFRLLSGTKSGGLQSFRLWLGQRYPDWGDLSRVSDNELLCRVSQAVETGRLAARLLPVLAPESHPISTVAGISRGGGASASAGGTSTGDGGAPAGWVLGQLSSFYETGGRGPGTVSSGRGDAGGVSYGSYQMTSRPGGGTVSRFVAEPRFPFKDRFTDLEPGSVEFSTAWKALADAQGAAFQMAQHDYIKRTHYDPMVKAISAKNALDVTIRSAALQDCAWSTAVQHGPGNSIFQTVLNALRLADTPHPEDGLLYDEAVIRRVYAERGRRDENGTLVHFRRNSAQVQQGVAGRFERELKDALAMLRGNS